MHDIINTLDHDFVDLVDARRRFSKELRKRKSVSYPRDMEDADEILDFFETIGSLVRTGAISFVLSDEQFAYWAIRYFLICRENSL